MSVRARSLRASKIGFFVAAGASFVVSVALWFGGSREEGLFIGLWVPSILSFGTLLFSRGASHV